MSIVVTGYPSTTSQSFTTPDSYDSSELVRYLVVDGADFPNDEYIEIEYNSETITVYFEEECRYTPVEIHFINQYGSQQTLTFYKARQDTLKTKRETYESDRGQPSTGAHQFIDYNVTGRTMFSVNSGFVDESLNDTFKEMMLSERIWTIAADNFVPLNISTSNLKYKNRQDDRLINYTIDFEYSYQDINNI
jgi:hypothetical protein